ncbi:RNA helicase [Plasmodiophora brassicae]|nr:hypothetical protein PBRA_008710 [Plasmodiophora brassicae]
MADPSATPSHGHDDVLPIDAHRDRIIDHIDRHRVTVIQGETGCGKSSRIPSMILDAEVRRGRLPRMMVSQPRRIAARALTERLRTSRHGPVYGLRMGHGERSETPQTRIWFVTSGYLVQYMSHHPDAFAQHTHLIIDEVHERSVDSDLLCMLARRLLTQHEHLRLIVMSATIQSKLYCAYFRVPDDQTLFVGARRFPVEICHTGDIRRMKPPKGIQYKLSQLEDACTRSVTQMRLAVPASTAKIQYEIALWILERLAAAPDRRPDSAVLIFVSGMSDILELSESIERMSTVALTYKVLPIHSELPIETQFRVFESCGQGEFKVVIATNAAESSLTLPDVDTVICLGTHKQVERIGGSDQTQLVNTWVPKSGAIQRAGRTGRVRPGRCFRLYSSDLFESLPDYEVPEVRREPLDKLILRLRSMLDQPVLPLLNDLIEPPSCAAIDAAFASLHRMGMIQAASDDGNLTVSGRFVSRLGVDIRCGRLLADSFVLGVMAEAIVVVATFQLAHNPYRMAIPLLQTPEEYNDIVCSTMLSAHHHDQGMFSEPCALMQLYKSWLGSHSRDQWARTNCVASTRMRQLDTIVRHLTERVSKSLAIPVDAIQLDPNEPLQPGVLLFIRLLLTWTFHDQAIRAKRTKGPLTTPNSVMVDRDALAPADVRRAFRSVNTILNADLERIESATFTVSHCDVSRCRPAFTDKCMADLKIQFVIVLGTESDRTFWVICCKELWPAFNASIAKELSGAGNLKQLPSSHLTAQHITAELTIPTVRQHKEFRKHLKSAVTQPSMIITLQKSQAAHVVCTRCCPTETMSAHIFGAKSKWHRSQSTHVERITFNDVPTQGVPVVQDCTGLGPKILTSIMHGYRGEPALKITSVDDPNRVIEARATVCRTSWELCSDLSESGSSASANVPRHSLLEGLGILNLKRHPVFAVASGVMFFGSNQKSIRVEGVTVLPQGETWLHLALLLIGIDTKSWLGARVQQPARQAAMRLHDRLAPAMRGLDTTDADLPYDIFSFFNDSTDPMARDAVTDNPAEPIPQPTRPVVHVPTEFMGDQRGPEDTNDLDITDVSVLTRLRDMAKGKGCGHKSHKDGGNKLKYACLRCGARSTWKKCLIHMSTKSSCKAFIAAVIQDIEKELADANAPAPAPDVSSATEVYQCLACGRQAPSWDTCLEHIRGSAACFQAIVQLQFQEQDEWTVPLAARIGQECLRSSRDPSAFQCPGCAKLMPWDDLQDHIEYDPSCRNVCEESFDPDPSDWMSATLVVDGLRERCRI